jgi:hypothetical protein
MAKQPSKSARADSSAGKSAVAVSNDTDAVAAAERSAQPHTALWRSLGDGLAAAQAGSLVHCRRGPDTFRPRAVGHAGEPT